MILFDNWTTCLKHASKAKSMGIGLNHDFYKISSLWRFFGKRVQKFLIKSTLTPNKLAKTFLFYVLIGKYTFRIYLVHFVDRNFIKCKDVILKKFSKFVKIHKSRFLSLLFSSIEHSIKMENGTISSYTNLQQRQISTLYWHKLQTFNRRTNLI